MAKSLGAGYAAGSRGAAWLKIKQAATLDLVVLAAEWGSGRRSGWLSNLHLGARDTERNGFVMLGKTFKGLTDKLLEWQTRRFLDLEIGRDRYTVFVRPELVVEIAFNDVQASPQYPGGVALRFARVKRYRDDKSAAEADTIETVQAHSPASDGAGGAAGTAWPDRATVSFARVFNAHPDRESTLRRQLLLTSVCGRTVDDGHEGRGDQHVGDDAGSHCQQRRQARNHLQPRCRQHDQRNEVADSVPAPDRAHAKLFPAVEPVRIEHVLTERHRDQNRQHQRDQACQRRAGQTGGHEQAVRAMVE